MTGDFILLFLAFWPILGGFVSYLIGRKNKKMRDYFADFVGILEFAIFAYLFVKVAGGAEYAFRLSDFCIRGLYLKLDGFRAIYGGIAALMWMMTTMTR